MISTQDTVKKTSSYIKKSATLKVFSIVVLAAVMFITRKIDWYAIETEPDNAGCEQKR